MCVHLSHIYTKIIKKAPCHSCLELGVTQVQVQLEVCPSTGAVLQCCNCYRGRGMAVGGSTSRFCSLCNLTSSSHPWGYC